MFFSRFGHEHPGKAGRAIVPVFAVALLATVTGSGCGLKFGQAPSKQISLSMGSAQSACLSGAAKTLGDYFNGNATDLQLSDAFSCASNALQLFEQRTRGARPGQYSPQELRNFMETYFLKGFTISDSLLSEIALLKQALVGGSSTELTIGEIDRVRGILNTLQEQSIILRPYLPLTPSHLNSLSTSDLVQVISALKGAANAVGDILEANSSPYPFDNMDTLLQQLEHFVQDPQEKTDIEDVRQDLPLFREVKEILVSPDSYQMIGSDWQVLLSRGADLYGLFLRYSSTIANEPTLISGHGLQALSAEVKDAYVLFQQVVAGNPMGTVSYCNMYGVIDQLSLLWGKQQDLGQLVQTGFAGYPVNLRPIVDPNMPKVPGEVDDPSDYLVYFQVGNYRIYRGSIKKFLQPLVQTLLKPQNDPTGALALKNGSRFPYTSACQINPYKQGSTLEYKDLGLTNQNLATLDQLLTYISQGQDFLQRVFQWAGQLSGDSPADAMNKPYLPQQLMSWTQLSDLYGNKPTPPADLVATLSDLIQHHRPFFVPNDTMMTFNSSDDRRHYFVGLSWLNAIRQVVRTAWMGYTNPNDSDPSTGAKEVWNAPHGGLLVDKIEQVYSDTKELGVAIDLYDPSAIGTSIPDERFLEANLFTYAADGNEFMSLGEGTDLVGFLVSAMGLSTRTYGTLHDECAQWYDNCDPTLPHERDGKPWSCNIGPLDVYGEDTISTACYRHFVFGEEPVSTSTQSASTQLAPAQPAPPPSPSPAITPQFPEMWDHMPDLSKFYASLPTYNGQNFNSSDVYGSTFACLLDQVARPTGSDPVWYNSSDFQEISALYHYLEGIYVRFDVNHEGELDQADAMLAYPVLAYELQTKITEPVSEGGYGITFLSSTADFQAVLNYLLAEGNVPDTSDLTSISTWVDVLQFAYRRYIYSSSYEADRARILQVMALIVGNDATVCFDTPEQQLQTLEQRYVAKHASSNPQPHVAASPSASVPIQ